MLGRVDMDPSDLRVLVKAGCLDSIAGGRSRPEMLWGLLAWEARREGKGQRAKGSGVGGQRGQRAKGKGEREKTRPGSGPFLFSGAVQAPKAVPYRPELLLRHELETLGLLVSRHPLEIYAPWLSRVKAVPASELAGHVGKKVTTVGWFVTGKTVLTRREEPMEFVSFEDTTALYETTFFPRAYERFSRMLGYHRPYLLRGRVEEDFGAVSLTVEDVATLAKGPSRKTALTPSDRRRTTRLLEQPPGMLLAVKLNTERRGRKEGN
jgi:error-prone DNA polymerase